MTIDFDADNFDLVRARQRVHEALAQLPPGELKKGQTLERTWDTGGDSELDRCRFMEEVKSSNMDKKLGGCCWNCESSPSLSGWAIVLTFVGLFVLLTGLLGGSRYVQPLSKSAVLQHRVSKGASHR